MSDTVTRIAAKGNGLTESGRHVAGAVPQPRLARPGFNCAAEQPEVDHRDHGIAGPDLHDHESGRQRKEQQLHRNVVAQALGRNERLRPAVQVSPR